MRTIFNPLKSLWDKSPLHKILLILLFPITLTYIIIAYKNWSAKTKTIVIVLFWALIGALNTSSNTCTVSTPLTSAENSTSINPSTTAKLAQETTPKTPFEKGTVTSVVDGDTIHVLIEDTDVTVRLIGIDTPETNHPSEPVQCFGKEATQALKDLILDTEVALEKDVSSVDKYGRALRYVWSGDVLVNEFMVRNGYAFASAYPPDVKFQDRLDSAEEYARTNSAGLWAEATCDGDVYTGTYRDPDFVEEAVDTGGAAPSSNTSVSTTESVPASNVSSVPSAPAPEPAAAPAFSCSCSKTCSEMVSCEEAYFQLNTCGCSARDGDSDGVPCESICR
ncbi:hypothetical protein GF360_01020 [candidate division WWE3 bacterium]|nr:hypothetical protein [candidate division WWE3 bacterium]